MKYYRHYAVWLLFSGTFVSLAQPADVPSPTKNDRAGHLESAILNTKIPRIVDATILGYDGANAAFGEIKVNAVHKGRSQAPELNPNSKLVVEGLGNCFLGRPEGRFLLLLDNDNKPFHPHNFRYPIREHNGKLEVQITMFAAADSDWKPLAGIVKRIPDDRLPAATSETSSSNTAKPSAANSIYVKVFLPLKPLDNDKHPVESWVLRQLKKQKVEHARAVTDWIKLPAYEDIESVDVWDATTDGKGWGCPVDGTLSKLRPDGKVNVELNGWLPFQPRITGNLILAETGNRRIAVVNGATRPAFFAILVGPPVP